MSRTGILYLVSGPSGSGKTTLCRRLAEQGEAHYSTSCTTRPPREGETHGKDYYFLSEEKFQAKVAEGKFLEHAEVHGNYYGTLKSEIFRFIEAGKDVVMDIDVQGATQVRTCQDPSIATALVDLFVMPPNENDLKSRLTGRGTDSADVIALRLKNALEEMTHWKSYSFLLISEDREADFERFKALLLAQRLHTARLS